MANHKPNARGVFWQQSPGMLSAPRAPRRPKGTAPSVQLIPKLTAMQKRLMLMRLALLDGRPPTVAQIGATYASMALKPSKHADKDWQALLNLAQHAIGVLDICRICNGSGEISGRYDYLHCGDCGAVHQPCTCTCPRTVPKGFMRVSCAIYAEGYKVRDTCQGSGWLRVHTPQPGDMQYVDKFSAELATRPGNTDIMQQVAAVLSKYTTR